MPSYDFLNLSPIEFEELSRDLLQKELGIIFENFKEGKDGGIDLRAWKNNKATIIVQCKRYENFNYLFTNLKKEVKKVKKLSFKKYILTTSVSLTVTQVKKIVDIYGGFLLEEDIYFRQKLNNLLRLHKSVETEHYKLWLASSNILRVIVNNKLHTQSVFEKENLLKIKNVFVQNKSFKEAKEKLQKNKFVIISGSPGIGKTTLARVLAYDYLANGFDEFWSLSSGISEAYDLYNEDAKQIFFFDDFLGTNFLTTSLHRNEDKRIVEFLEKIQKSQNKIFLLTTREYIINQALSKHEVLKNSSIEISKCILDISKYTKQIKAKILYNHLYFADIPEQHLLEFIENKVYLRLINHINYNPRIIETVIKRKEWTKLEPQKFSLEIVNYFDNPFSVWEGAFLNDISRLSQIILLQLLSCGGYILYEDLQNLVQSFVLNNYSEYLVECSPFRFKESIKELINTFISTEKDSEGNVAIGFQNPSIEDFLTYYLKQEAKMQIDIIKSAQYFNQLFYLFGNSHNEGRRNNLFAKTTKIKVNEKLMEVISQKILADFDKMMFSEIIKYNIRNRGKIWRKMDIGLYRKLNMICNENYTKYKEISSFVVKTFNSKLVPINLSVWEVDDYLNLIKIVQLKKPPKYEIMESFLDSIKIANDFHNFGIFENIFPKEFSLFIKENLLFKAKVNDAIDEIFSEAEGDSIESAIDDLENIYWKYGIDTNEEVSELKARKIEYEEELDQEEIIDNIQTTSYSEETNIYDDEFNSLFDSLLQ